MTHELDHTVRTVVCLTLKCTNHHLTLGSKSAPIDGNGPLHWGFVWGGGGGVDSGVIENRFDGDTYHTDTLHLC